MGSREEDLSNGNGVRVSNREIFDKVNEVHDILVAEKAANEEKWKNSSLQFKLLWGLLLSNIGSVAFVISKLV